MVLHGASGYAQAPRCLISRQTLCEHAQDLGLAACQMLGTAAALADILVVPHGKTLRDPPF
jgi:hypothetical protein